ncbi:hypothetical protein ACWDOR_33250 [Streptosporangium canum]
MIPEPAPSLTLTGSAPQAHSRPFGEIAAAMNALMDTTSILRGAKGHRTP